MDNDQTNAYSETTTQTRTDPDQGRAKTWLLPEQITELTRATLDQHYTYLQDRDEAMVELLADTGLRVGEFVQVDVDMLNLEADPPEIILPARIQKGGGPGQVPLELEPSTAHTLERYLDRRPWTTPALFPTRQSDRGHPNSVRNAIKSAAERAEIRPYVVDDDSEDPRVRGDPDDVTPHTLRHSVAYRMIRREDQRMVDVQMRLRHSDLDTTTRVYGHLRVR